jgi:hypothetical protein
MMMAALDSEVQEYGGWENISCVQVDGKMRLYHFEYYLVGDLNLGQ